MTMPVGIRPAKPTATQFGIKQYPWIQAARYIPSIPKDEPNTENMFRPCSRGFPMSQRFSTTFRAGGTPPRTYAGKLVIVASCCPDPRAQNE
jgi:hypothetical protein